MSRIALVLLVVLVALAGCNGVFGGETDDVEKTFTPVAVPTAEPTPTPVPRLAPGLTVEGVVNASALAAAHDAVLENTSFTVWEVVTYRTRNGTPIRRVRSVAHIGADGRFLVTKRWSGTPQRVVYYYDGERLLVATTDSRGTTYHRASPEIAILRRSVATGSGQIERVFLAAETRVVGRTTHNGTTVYRLVPETQTQSMEATSFGRSVSVKARVTERGLVRTYTFRQTLNGEGSDGAAVIVVSTRYTEVGSTTIERPAWYDEALSATTNSTVSNPTTGRSQ